MYNFIILTHDISSANIKVKANMVEHTEKITTELLYVLVSAMGGVAKYLNEYLKTGKFNWRLFFANIVLSAFSGIMFKLF